MANVFWFRRDLRLAENEAMAKAVRESDGNIYGVVDLSDLIETAKVSHRRANSLYASWVRLNESIGGNLNVIHHPEIFLSKQSQADIRGVYVTAAYDPISIQRMKPVRSMLTEAKIEFEVAGSNYLVTPGKVRKPDGTPYRVFTPFYRQWVTLLNLDVEASAVAPSWLQLQGASSFDPTTWPDVDISGWQVPAHLPVAGEAYALETLEKFIVKGAADSYGDIRDRADLSGTSHLSHALSHGEIHPRTIARAVTPHSSAEKYIRELAWREFYADVLWHNPESLTEYLEPRFAKMRYDDNTELGEKRFRAWCEGKTGYPMVDAGMRQLIRDGWVHNRVRMIVASFLIKDLHIEWQRGAEWFERNLTDYDPASNSHGWQWTAGCGTDAAPYYRVFNPILQGLKFDPNGDYVRKYVPELRHLEGSSVHEPWSATEGYAGGYPERIVDHFKERDESLARLEELKQL